MDFKVRHRRSVIKPEFTLLDEKYPHFMQFYREPPTDEVTFKEFEECTAERLSLLQVIDEIGIKGFKGDAWVEAITSEMRKHPELRQFSKLVTGTRCHDRETDYMIRQRDHISHFVLRLAYSSTEDKRRWFIARELDLFRFRWIHLSNEDRLAFLRCNGLNYELVSKEARIELELASLGMLHSAIDCYKIPFVLASDLIRARKVYLRKGFAYVTSQNIIAVILTSYRSQLSQSLSYVSRRLYKLGEDERIVSVLKGAANNVRVVDYVIEDKDKISISSLDDLCASSYPLCMQNLHRTIRQDHHLKHFGRQQYGLFLKGIGVTLEDAMQFWRIEFTKKMDVDTFEKKYSYNIRHNYGKEGKRANYTPLSCSRIINGSVNPGDNHGCPFRHRDPVLVKRMLALNGVSPGGVNEVIDLMRKGQFQVACSKYFYLKHKVEFAVNHPNSYFDESQLILRGKTKEPSTDNRRSNQTPHKGGTTPGKSFSTPGNPLSTPKRSGPTPSKADDTWNDSGLYFNSIEY